MDAKTEDDLIPSPSVGSLKQPRHPRAKYWVVLFVKFLLCAFVLRILKHATDKHRASLRPAACPAPEDIIGTVKWFQCDEPVAPGTDCGSIVVPLDYLNHTKGTSTIALARYKATANPKRGTLFLNPGGPGSSDVEFAIRGAALLRHMFGPYYDLVGFDPRGIGKTTPKVFCFPSPIDRQFFISNTVFDQGFTVSSDFSDPQARDHLIEQCKEFLTLKEAQAKLCAENVGDNLKYMGSTTVARDIDFMATISDGKDALINYFGGSYGTVLGMYLVNMYVYVTLWIHGREMKALARFPDRVGRVAIDGIANPVLWAAKSSQYWRQDWIVSAEDTYQVFLKECSKAGPYLCPLTRYVGEDTKEMEKRINDFLDKLYDTPVPVPHAGRPGYLTAGAVRVLLFIYMESPRLWPEAARNLASASAGDGSGLLNKLLPQYVPEPTPDLSFSVDLQRLAVTCLDSPPPKSASEFPTAEELADIGLETIRNVSRHFGMSVSVSESDGGFQFWPVQPSERFTGPWNQTLKNPILVVSNTADPVTPLRNGKLVNSLLGNSSRLLIQDSPGHCSLGLASLCTLNAYRVFFINGTLPPNELVCPTDESPFPDEFGYTEAVEVHSMLDRQLLYAARQLGQWLTSHKLSRSVGNLDWYQRIEDED